MNGYRRVRDLREDHDKTQKDIAVLLNMQLTVYQRYERGERELPLWAAIKLADYYNVTLDSLVGRDFKKNDTKMAPQILQRQFFILLSYFRLSFPPVFPGPSAPA